MTNAYNLFEFAAKGMTAQIAVDKLCHKRDHQTQSERILKYLENGNDITPLAALRMFGCLRLGARIWDLRHKQGIPIQRRMLNVGNGKSVAQYYLEDIR